MQCVLLEKFKNDIELTNETRNSESNAQDSSSLSSLQVGRKLINEKSIPVFNDYVRKALNKLNLSNDKVKFKHAFYFNFFILFFCFKFEISDEEIEEYLKKHEHMKSKFDIFIQFKHILSPIIEYIILLDRLIYLYEYELSNSANSKDVYFNCLVRLFDPSKSPRCHALISYVK